MNSKMVNVLNSESLTFNESYSSNYEYDRNGNLKKLNRTAPLTEDFNSLIEPMDSLSYDYIDGSNKLALVKDNITNTGLFVNDLENQIDQLNELGYTYDINNMNSHNYIYDEIGQLIEDRTEKLVIQWRVDGKVKKIIKDNGSVEINFVYDGLGNRIAKTKKTLGRLSSNTVYSTLYSRDAQGNVLGVYNHTKTYLPRSGKSETLSLNEHHIYGSSRMGIEEKDLLVYRYRNFCLYCRDGETAANLPTSVDTYTTNQIVGGAMNINNTNSYYFNINKSDYLYSFSAIGQQGLNLINSNLPSIIKNSCFNSYSFSSKIKMNSNNSSFDYKQILNNKDVRFIDGQIDYYANSHTEPMLLIFGSYTNKITVKLSVKKNIDNTYTFKGEHYDFGLISNVNTPIGFPNISNYADADINNNLIIKTFESENINSSLLEGNDAVDFKVNLDNSSMLLYINGSPINMTIVSNNIVTNENYSNYSEYILEENYQEGISKNYFGNPTSSPDVQYYQISLCDASFGFSDGFINQNNNTNDVQTSVNLANNNIDLITIKNENSPISYSNLTDNSLDLRVETYPSIVDSSPFYYSSLISDSTFNPIIYNGCPIDSDLDGVYDHYEMLTITNGGLQDLNTDSDNLVNRYDPDDDGDGILSKYEGNDPNGDHNPTDAIDTDGDGIPNYLDADDDNDGYATWETYEGGTGVVNAEPGLPYTVDVDQDNIVNYLDPTDGMFPVNGPMTFNTYINLIGDKRFELANHLGNVLVVINDKKIPNFAIEGDSNSELLNFNADVLSYNDYYPFGMLVPNRHSSSDSYRYGFNGKEKDDEIKSKKTKTFSSIKLPEFAVIIVKKFRTKRSSVKLFPKYDLANFNEILKRIGEKAGWTQEIHTTREVKGISKTDQKKKKRFCDQMSSHMMRRTAITTMLVLGMPEHLVKKISGHSQTSGSFNRYVHYAQSYLDAEIDKVHEKLNNF